MSRRRVRAALAAGSLVVGSLVAVAGLGSPASAAAAPVVTSCRTGDRALAATRREDTRVVGRAERSALVKVMNRRTAPARMATVPAAGPITINVRAHVLKSTNRKRPYASAKQVAETVQVLNDAYSGGEEAAALPTPDAGGVVDSGFRFRLLTTDITRKTTWYWAQPRTSAERAMKRKLHKGAEYGLNIYFINQPASTGLLGWSTFPWDRAARPLLDGVVMHSMPGGSFAHYNLGDTATHEVGHWLGLYHTFSDFGTCEIDNDQVDDTPIQLYPSNGCPEGNDTCPLQPGLDAIHNFMDYSYDACMNQFSQGQADRMQAEWALYRAAGHP